MIIPVSDLARVWNVRPTGVLHVGAHEGEEADTYAKHGWTPVWWVDMLPDKCEILRNRFCSDPSNQVLQGACWDESGVALDLHRAVNGQSSSLLAPTDHLREHPEVTFEPSAPVFTTRLDALLPDTAHFDFVNVDVQGAELRALKGLGRHLDHVKWVYAEVNTRPLYEGCCLISDLDDFFHSSGFQRVATKIAGKASWGDALYVNTSRTGPSSVPARLRQAGWHVRQVLEGPLGLARRAVRKLRSA